MKIGLFGGSFDPWTVAHQAIVDKVLDEKLVDFVVILPTIVDYHRPGKNKWLSDKEKFDIIYSFLLKSPHSDKIMMDFREIRMRNSKELSDEDVKNWRFINTLDRCKKQFPNDELFVILGTDSIRNFKTWHRWEDIVAQAKLIGVDGRNGEHVETDIPFTRLEIPESVANISSSEIREKFKTPEDYFKYIRG